MRQELVPKTGFFLPDVYEPGISEKPAFSSTYPELNQYEMLFL
jgi:hypothetical protein